LILMANPTWLSRVSLVGTSRPLPGLRLPCSPTPH